MHEVIRGCFAKAWDLVVWKFIKEILNTHVLFPGFEPAALGPQFWEAFLPLQDPQPGAPPILPQPTKSQDPQGDVCGVWMLL